MAQPRFRHYFRHGFFPQLVAFEACLRLGSVTRAAEELCLAQPTVSGLLGRLSETVGEPVLRLRGGRMMATEAGCELALLCDEIFDSLARYDAARRAFPSPLGEGRGEGPCNVPYAPASEIFRADHT